MKMIILSFVVPAPGMAVSLYILLIFNLLTAFLVNTDCINWHASHGNQYSKYGKVMVKLTSLCSGNPCMTRSLGLLQAIRGKGMSEGVTADMLDYASFADKFCHGPL